MGNHEAERVIQRPKGLAVAELIVPNGREARHSHREAGPQSSAFPVFGALFPPSSRLFSAPGAPAKIARHVGDRLSSRGLCRSWPRPRCSRRRCRAAAPSIASEAKRAPAPRWKRATWRRRTPWQGPSKSPGPRRARVKCGFVFSPDQLRANFLAAEAQAGNHARADAEDRAGLRLHGRLGEPARSRTISTTAPRTGRRRSARTSTATSPGTTRPRPAWRSERAGDHGLGRDGTGGGESGAVLIASASDSNDASCCSPARRYETPPCDQATPPMSP